MKIRLDTATGAVRSLRGNLSAGPPTHAEATLWSFLGEYRDLFGLEEPTEELEITRISADELGYQTIHLHQRTGGVPVLGGEMRADIDPAGRLVAVSATLQPNPTPRALHPRISASQALVRGRGATGPNARSTRIPELVVTRLAVDDRLVWRVVFLTDEPARWQLLVDAVSGEIVEQRNILAFTGPNRRTYTSRNSPSLPGTLLRSEGNPPSGDAHADAAHGNAGRVYDYFRKNFGRDSIDGLGGTIVSSVHYRANPSEPYNNAYWDGSQMVYGDGDGVLFGPLGTALDVVGHELTHGITQYTAGLVYAEQPGALNEAFSDIFGALIDDANWEIAESVFTPGIAGDALRSLADPTQYGQPSVWGEYLKLPDTSSTDYGGVHVNSGIINHVAFTIAEQIGREKLGHIFYRTLTMKLISRSDFLDARDAAVQACGELAGTNGITQSDCLKVEWSFAMAGIGGKPSLPEGMRYRLFMPLVTEPTWSCASNLIDNAGFEEQGSWVAWSSVAGAWGLQSEGTRSARLNNTDQMLQLIRLHSGAEHLALSFDTFWDSATGGNQVEISLEDPTTHKPLAPPARVGSELKAGTWQRISIPLQVASGMSTVRLVFKHLVSSGGSGVFYVDNVQLTTKCPTP